ncbi:MAG TPA: YhcH/YjgK/YiaL family protein [Spirochaetales bacterium]|nr:YhcH/YjgK/YiaL family protein [Spirochaetales bacterium]HRY54862.1 YhcH/YjgK/YiaL family protein [Spirochaetia bacterium]HRZ65770.1 YhcH/YjgK/YiaL family protein [Spirochaetia bacterium]
MIFDSIANRPLYRGLGADLDLALDALAALAAEYASSSGAGFESGKKIVLAEDGRGPRVWYTLQEYRTKGSSDCVLEAHRAHLDIHLYLAGQDGIGIARTSARRVTAAYDAEKDCSLHEPPEGMPILVAGPGDFLVCFPDDAHMPMVAGKGREGPVRKAICKIRL